MAAVTTAVVGTAVAGYGAYTANQNAKAAQNLSQSQINAQKEANARLKKE